MIYRWFCRINPEPWTSPTATLGRKNGRMVPFVHKNPKLRTYQLAVQEEFDAVAHDLKPVEGPIKLEFAFSRSTVGGQPCDVTNLQKATEDALQGHLFKNDSQVVQVSSRIKQSREEESWLAVELFELGTSIVEAYGNFPAWIRKQRDSDTINSVSRWDE